MIRTKFYYYFRIKILGGGYKEIPQKEYILREIAVLSSSTLSTLALTIVRSFNYYFDHCYGFYDNFKSPFSSKEMYELFTDIPEDPTPGAKGVRYTKIPTAFPKVGKKMLFLYDYGDNWLFEVELKEIKMAPQNAKNPKIVKKSGIAPKQYPPEEKLTEDDLFDDCDVCLLLKEDMKRMKKLKRLVN